MTEIKPLSIGNLTAKIPVIQGGMGVGVSLSNLAGAVASCGGIGIISTAQIGYREPDFYRNPFQANFRALAAEIRRAKEKAGNGIIGVNIMVATRRYADYVREAVKAGADLIISGAGLPTELPELVKGTSTKIAPIISNLKGAKVILKYWEKKHSRIPDLLVVEGPMAGGHLGFSAEELDHYAEEPRDYERELCDIIAFVREYEAKKGCRIPVVAAGGIFDRKDMDRALALGADGVQVATRFVTTYECDADMAFKQAYLDAGKEDIQIVKSPVGMAGRAIRNPFLERASKARIPVEHCYQCINGCVSSETPYCITSALVNAVKGNVDEGLLFCGENAWRCEKMEHVSDIMREFSE